MNENRTVSKFSVSLPTDLTAFLKEYQKSHGVSRSEVVARALTKLREQELANAYKQHAENWQDNPDKDFWDAAAVDDGLDSNESSW